MRRILDLEALDFSLDEERAAVGGELAGADLRALLEAKRRAAQRALLEARNRLDRIESALAEGVTVGPSPPDGGAAPYDRVAFVTRPETGTSSPAGPVGRSP